MSLELVPRFTPIRSAESCLFDLRASDAGLVLAVETFPAGSATSVEVEIVFQTQRGFFVLNDPDGPDWVNPATVESGHLVYEVRAGGWLSGRPSGAFAVAGVQCKEWLVVTGNECVSVFSGEEPGMREKAE
jgi:hypothetical protein